jgi:isocitrate/isopropylmalate dehydrogenase
MTRHKTERIARFAFDFAIKNGRKVCRVSPRPLLAFSL